MDRLRGFDVSPLQVFGLTLAAVTLAIGLRNPFPATVEHDVVLVLAIFVATIFLWITKPVPYVVSSILCLILLYVLGPAASFEEAASGFASSLIFFLILLLLIGTSVAKVDLDVWMANRLISSYSTPKASLSRIGVTLLALAFIMPSGVARAVTFIPVIDEINSMYGMDKNSHFRRVAYYTVGHLNIVSSIAVMTGGGMAIATSEMINSLVTPITWLDWLFYMGPPVVLLFGLCLVITSLGYTVSDDVQITTDEPHSDIDGEIEPLTGKQKLVIGTLFFSIVLWILFSFIGVPAIVPAIFAVLVFTFPGVGIITTEDIRSSSWGIVFVVGAMLSLITVMEEVEAFDLISEGISFVLPMHLPNPAILFILFIAAIIVRTTFSSVAGSFIVLFPILLEFINTIGANSLYMSFSLAMLITATGFLPFNNPTVLIAYENGPLRAREVFILGTLTLALAFVVVAFSWVVYWPALEQVGGV